MLRIGLKGSMVAAALATAGLVAACSSGGSSPTTSATGTSAAPTSASSSSAAPSDVKIGVSFYTERIPIYATMRQGIEAAAAAAGVEIIYADANAEVETQTNQIANMVTNGVAVIICSPVDATAMVPAYEAARSAGVKMISAGNKVDDKYEDAFVGPDLVDYGAQTMQRLVDGIGGKGKIMLITGPPQIAFVQLQKMGWDSVLAEYPDVEVVAEGVVEDLSTAKAVDVATSLLTANPDVVGIMSSTDNIGVGVVQALEAAGIDPATVFTAGWDAQQNAVDLVKEGKYTLTLSYLAYKWGEIAFQTALDMANGKMPEGHYVVTPGLFIDKANAATLTQDQIDGKVPVS